MPFSFLSFLFLAFPPFFFMPFSFLSFLFLAFRPSSSCPSPSCPSCSCSFRPSSSCPSPSCPSCSWLFPFDPPPSFPSPSPFQSHRRLHLRPPQGLRVPHQRTSLRGNSWSPASPSSSLPS